jgi:Tfp pilus assembly protein FimT
MIRNVRGYSLIELLGAVALTCFAAALAYPKYISLSAAYRVQYATRAVIMDLQKTRFRAVAEGGCFQVAFTAGSSTYQLKKLSAGSCATTGTFDDDGEPRSFDDTGAVATGFSVSPIFMSRGTLVPGTQATVQLNGVRGGTRQIAVKLSGAVDVL